MTLFDRSVNEYIGGFKRAIALEEALDWAKRNKKRIPPVKAVIEHGVEKAGILHNAVKK